MAEDSGAKVIPDVLHWEMLRWLPVKSLMRFKCVSVAWNSIIKDPSFAQVYRGGSQGLLIHGDKASQSGNSHRIPFYFSTLDSRASRFSHYTTISHDEEWKLTNFVNGLLCTYIQDRPWLYNLATRESLELPSSGEDWDDDCRYHLGFDPTAKRYKLLMFCLKSSRNCKILTIGVDSSWRDLQFGFTSVLQGLVSYWDGVIYWWDHKSPIVNPLMVAFDLVVEEFRFVFFNPGSENRYHLPYFGPLAMTSQFSDRVGGLLTRYSYKRNSGAKGNWFKDDPVSLPSHAVSGCFEGILPNGKVLTSRLHNFTVSFCLFDPKTKETQTREIVIKTDPSFSTVSGGNYSEFVRYFYQENIISLKCLTSTS